MSRRSVLLIGSAAIVWSVVYIAQMHTALVSPISLQEKAGVDEGLSIDERVEKMLQSMTLAQKVGQMTQIDVSDVLYGKSRDPVLAINRARVAVYAKLGIGSYFNSPFDENTRSHGHTGWTATEWRMFLGTMQAIYKEHNAIPFIYGIDTTHGANYVRNATIFPQPLATASTFNPELAYAMGRIEAKDSVAAGIPWIFSPVLGIAMQPKWSRVYETLGEDPYLVSQMGVAIIRGIQSSNLSAACMKHFIGYSNPTSGNDRADSVINDFELLNYYAPPFIAAVRDGNVLSAMETYTSVNGDPVVQSRKLLVDLLRNDIQFNGLLVSDDDEIHRLVDEHHVARNDLEALEMVMNRTSLDLNMVSEKHRSTSLLSKLINASHIPMSRLDDSVRRILKLKASLGLLPTSESDAAKHATITSSHLTTVGSQEDFQLAQTTADESIILLKNKMQEPIDAVNPKMVLPIIDPNAKIFVTGPLAHNKAYLCGGWTVYWQGTDDSAHIPHGLSIKEALEARFKNVVYHEGVDVDGYADGEVRPPPPDDENILTLSAKYNSSLARATAADYTIVVVGEAPYAEKAGDIDDLTLPQGQLDYITTLSTIKTTNLIVVIVAGRPRLLAKSLVNAHAVLLSFLPCEAGGEAIAKVIAGDVNPSGRLPLTYPSSTGHTHVPYFHRMNIACKDSFSECPVEWPFGSGLSYTTFKYDNLTLSEWQVNKENGTLGVQVTVTNTGTRAGKEVVMLFVSQKVRHYSVPETKMLRRFKKIDLMPGGVETVYFELTQADWSYYVPDIGNGFHAVAEEGLFHVLIKHDTNCNGVKKNSMCAHFHVV